MHDIRINFQKVPTDTSEKSVQKLNDIDRVNYRNILRNPNYENYKPKFRETKSFRFEKNRNNLDEHVNEISNKSSQSETDSDDLEGQGIEKIFKPIRYLHYIKKPSRSKHIRLYLYPNRS